MKRSRHAASASPFVALTLALALVSPSVAAEASHPGKAPAPAATGTPATAPAAVSPPPRPSLADTLTGQAKDDYLAGRLLFGDHDYGGALVKFRSAYDTSKDARLLFNMAACEKNLRHYEKTIELFERYRTDAGASFTDTEREDVERYLSELRPFVGGLRVTVNEPGAAVYVDDELIGTSPLANATRVDIGQRRIRVTKEGFTEFSTTMVVAGSGDLQIDARLDRVVHAGRLIVHAAPEDAVAIDGQVLGAGQFDGTLPSGGHQLQVTAKGMQTFQSEIVLLDGQVRTVDVKLVPVPGRIPAWAWVVAGGLVLGGAVVGTVILLQPSPTPPQVTGTIPPGYVTIASAVHAAGRR
jgi:PEGA domain